MGGGGGGRHSSQLFLEKLTCRLEFVTSVNNHAGHDSVLFQPATAGENSCQWRGRDWDREGDVGGGGGGEVLPVRVIPPEVWQHSCARCWPLYTALKLSQYLTHVTDVRSQGYENQLSVKTWWELFLKHYTVDDVKSNVQRWTGRYFDNAWKGEPVGWGPWRPPGRLRGVGDWF